MVGFLMSIKVDIQRLTLILRVRLRRICNEKDDIICSKAHKKENN